MSRRTLILSFVALFILRFAIGFHFFNEGTTKLRSGSFDAKYFFLASKGPLAEHFHSLVDDHDGKLRLCLVQDYDEQGNLKNELDPYATFLFWRDFLDRADGKYHFGSENSIREAEKECARLAEKIRVSHQDGDPESDSAHLKDEFELKNRLADIRRMRRQRSAANEIIERYEQKLADYLYVNREEILAYFRGEERGQGFERDGLNRKQVSMQVESLLGQVTTIENDRNKKAASWYNDIEQIWNGYEFEINELASAEQKANGTVKLVRPFSPPNSKMKFINQVVPWFDITVGCLLMLGLFSRLASLMGAGFLATVIATQPPWVMDAAPTYYQMIELAGLLVIFATCAGRFAGLDFFLHQIWVRFIVGEKQEDLESGFDS